ncbi:MAG: hypothetical protein N2248_00365 [candidate division WOR-3 bacterium]|nr:hypothetical protein [candidate division WOR-3 bacterium]
MQELIEVIKVTGPAIAILLWLVIQYRKENAALQDHIYDLYQQIINLSSGQRTRIGYIQYLSSQISELQNEINRLKQEEPQK